MQAIIEKAFQELQRELEANENDSTLGAGSTCVFCILSDSPADREPGKRYDYLLRGTELIRAPENSTSSAAPVAFGDAAGVKLRITTTTSVLEALAAGITKPYVVFMNGKLSVEGDRSALAIYRPYMTRVGKQLKSELDRLNQAVELWPYEEDAAKWENGDSCYQCQVPFSFFLRRHHCRLCNHAFCHEHSSHFVSKAQRRVCDGCFKDPLASSLRVLRWHLDKHQTEIIHTSPPASPTTQAEFFFAQATAQASMATASPPSPSFLQAIGLPSLFVYMLSWHYLLAGSSSSWFTSLASIVILMGSADLRFFVLSCVMTLASYYFFASTLLSTLSFYSPATFSCDFYFALLTCTTLFTLFVRHSSAGFARLIRVYTCAIVLIVSYTAVNTIAARLLHLSEERQEHIHWHLDQFLAPYACEQVLQLKSVFVKFGQYIGSRADMVPETWRSVLAKLQDDMPCDRAGHVQAAMDALRRRAVAAGREDLMLKQVDPVPLASASIAQCHVGTLENNSKVILKIQHEGVGAVMRTDMVALKRIMRVLVWLNPTMFDPISGVLEAWEQEMVKELDFRIECGNLLTVAKNLHHGGLDRSKVIVPVPVVELVEQCYFVMEFCPGFKITDVQQLEKSGVDKTALFKRIMHAFAMQLFVDGQFNADPHPGNLFVQIKHDVLDEKGLPTAVPVLLDFGMVVTLPTKQRLAYCELMLALETMDAQAMAAAIKQVGYENTQSEAHPERDAEFFEYLLRDTGVFQMRLF